MAFDIRNYTNSNTENKKNEEFWTQKYLRNIDEFFPKINTECETLLNTQTLKSADAFNNKIEAWKSFVSSMQRLCSLYKVKDAKCLS